MEKSIKERLIELKNGYKKTTISFMNNGEINEETYDFFKKMTENYNLEKIKDVEEYLYKAAECYARNYEYDSLRLHLILGLVYNKEDVEDNIIKEGAKPYNNLVRYYTHNVDSLLDGEKTNIGDYYRIGLGRQGYLNYNDLVYKSEADGLEFVGPRTFEEFKEAILSKEPFDISLVADLKEELDEPMKLVRK